MCLLHLLKFHISTRGFHSPIGKSQKSYYRRNPVIFEEPNASQYSECVMVNFEDDFAFKSAARSGFVLEDYLVDCAGFHATLAEQSKR